MRLQVNIRSAFFSALLLTTLGASAQEIPSRTNEGIRRTETKREQYNGYQKLNLSADQKSRLAVLQKEGRAALAALRKEQALSPDEKREKLTALRQEQTQKQMAILTPLQQKIWKEEGLGTRGGKQQTVVVTRQNTGSRALPAMDGKSAVHPNLTRAQQQEINELAQTFKEQARSVRQNPALSATEKELRTEALKKEFRKKRKALLTPEQRQRWVRQDRKRKNISQQ